MLFDPNVPDVNPPEFDAPNNPVEACDPKVPLVLLLLVVGVLNGPDEFAPNAGVCDVLDPPNPKEEFWGAVCAKPPKPLEG